MVGLFVFVFFRTFTFIIPVYGVILTVMGAIRRIKNFSVNFISDVTLSLPILVRFLRQTVTLIGQSKGIVE